MSTSQKSIIIDEIKFSKTSRKVLFYLFLVYLGINILVATLFDIYLTINHPFLEGGILGALLGISLFIQIREYFLYNKLGKNE